MGLPQVNIVFKTLGTTAIQRGERGIVALLLKDTAGLGTYTVTNATEIPSALSAANKKQIELALIGGQNTPNKVIVRAGNEATWSEGLAFLETVLFNYLAIPEIAEADKATVTSWVASQRQNGKMVKAILPNHAADKEYVVNFATDDIVVDDVTYTTQEYCSRIAGLIAGTPLSISTTFQPLPEVESVQSYTKSELDAAIDAGKFVIYHDGSKVKVARGITSLTTTSSDKGEDFKKIKVVDILDLWYSDVKTTLEDNYVGKYANSYDNKVLLIQAIKAYNEQLEADNLLDPGKNTVGIDLDQQKIYLQSIGQPVDKMSEQQIKEANTRDKVFLLSLVKPLDAIEDINMNVLI